MHWMPQVQLGLPVSLIQAQSLQFASATPTPLTFACDEFYFKEKIITTRKWQRYPLLSKNIFSVEKADASSHSRTKTILTNHPRPKYLNSPEMWLLVTKIHASPGSWLDPNWNDVSDLLLCLCTPITNGLKPTQQNFLRDREDNNRRYHN